MLNTSNFDTIADFLRYGISMANQHGLYYGHGTDNAWDDIWSLIAGTLWLPMDCRPELLQARLTHAEKETLTQRLQRRILERVPVPYLLQQAHFCQLSFYVDERVLIPRSPIAELIQAQFSPWIEDPDTVSDILDLCTGSGCIAIACCEWFPEAQVDAVDLSTDALDVAVINRERYHLEDQLQLIQSDCWEKVPAKQYDIIVSNPPYVGGEEMASLPKEYQHEPNMALYADQDGLAIVEKILQKAHHYLKEQGILVVEVGNSQDLLSETYPDLPFVWLDFEQGGYGVFLLSAEQLRAYWQEHPDR